MPTPILELLSRTIYSTDGVTTIWNFNFAGGYLDKAHVKAYIELPTGLRENLTVVPANVVGESQLQITPPLVAGNTIVIYRDTPKNLPIVDFTDGSGLSELALDTNAKQAVFLAAESADTVSSAPILEAIEAALIAEAAAARAEQAAADAAASDPFARSIMQRNASSAVANETLAAGYNAVSAGPITIPSDITITVNPTSTWVIL